MFCVRIHVVNQRNVGQKLFKQIQVPQRYVHWLPDRIKKNDKAKGREICLKSLVCKSPITINSAMRESGYGSRENHSQMSFVLEPFQIKICMIFFISQLFAFSGNSKILNEICYVDEPNRLTVLFMKQCHVIF